MNIQSEIDDTLRRLGTVEPPSGLAKRIHLRLENKPHRFSFSRVHSIAACALAASVALCTVALNPGLRSLALHHQSGAPSTPAQNAPRVVAPAAGGFGTASAVHVPAEPVPVQPTPVNQGRGRSRSARAMLPNSGQAPLPRGVVAPTAPVR
jgi:hypothetical protein